MTIRQIPLLLQVNGMPVGSVRIRAALERPHEAEVVITDPSIGDFALTDDCAVKVRPLDSGDWRDVRVEELLTLLRPEQRDANEGLNGEDVLERKLFWATYHPESEKETVDVTAQEWEWSVRKAGKALFTRGIPHFVMSRYTPPSRHNDRRSIQIYVPDPAAACEWLCKVGFNAISSTPDQVVDPDTSLTVCFRKGKML